MAKGKRVWTDEQRKAAADRMREMQRKRWDGRGAIVDDSGSSDIAVVEEVREWERPDPSDPRMAKLRMAQANLMAKNPDAQEALARHEAQIKGIIVEGVDPMANRQGRMRAADFMVRLDGRGLMVSTLGPCWCGRAKREWHGVH